MNIIFVCHGNICRSPMAEWIMKDLADKAGREDEFTISSAAVSYEEEGNGLYTYAARTLSRHGVPFGTHKAHRITLEEFTGADLIIIMDESNSKLLKHITGSADFSKVHKMLEWTGENRNVEDPWYTGDFEKAYQDISDGCKALLRNL